MSLTMPRMLLTACLLSSSFFGPSLSWALGLGEIHLNSALNEPMNAEIDLIAAAPDELTALRATLASRESFTRYGIDKPPFLSTLTFKVGKSKDGRDVLQVHSTDAIPEPFVTFLVEVNWARGRLMREYTVLLDPPVYTPGENAGSSAPVAPPSTTAAAPRKSAAPVIPIEPAPTPRTTASTSTAESVGPQGVSPDSIRVNRGDTLSKIVHGLEGPTASPVALDQTMIAMYRANPEAFGGNINILRQGSVLRVPGADQIAALNQKEAVGEVHRQIEAWRGSEAGSPAASPGHLRLVTPSAGGSATGTGNSSTANSNAGNGENQALKDRVKDLEGQLADSKRLIDIKSNELSALQHKFGVAATPPPAPVTPPAAVKTPPVAHAPPVTTPPSAVSPPPATPPAATTTPPATDTPVPVPPPVAPKPPVKVAPATPESGSWLDWVQENWWAPIALLVVVLGGLAFAAMRRRRGEARGDLNRYMDDTDVADPRDPTSKLSALRKGNESFVVEESGEHAAPAFGEEPGFADVAEGRSPEDTMSSESAVNLDQGDPLAEADFHMAYGLYDQAADLVRIALEREPDRRDLRLKLLEIYFVWGNKDAFLHTAKGLEATRDRAPAGEWDKIVIMGKQICPDEPMFASNTGSGRGAGALVDLNLEGGENRVDIDLFGEPEGERSSLDHQLAKEADDIAATGESPAMRQSGDHLDFTLDTPERGADDSPTREMAPRDEPTVESELMNFSDANMLEGLPFGAPPDSPTQEAPALRGNDLHDRIAAKLPTRADQTAEVSIDDLGLDLDQLEQTGTVSNSISHNSISQLETTDHPSDAPTMVAGLDERSRRMMAEAEKVAREHAAASEGTGLTERDRDLTELERELEASFVAELDSSHDEIKTAVLGPESAPTVLMPRETDPGASSRFNSSEFIDLNDPDKHDLDSTSKLRGLTGESIDLDLDRLASALGSGDTVSQPRAAEDLFSTEVFEASQRNKRVDLDVGEALSGNDSPTNKLQAQTHKLQPVDLGIPELEPVTMSEVGTKLDLARAYMDMGDPEGARSILEEVVQEGSASQKQEASRLIESLPG
jgi:pilus assembly protein FimV